MHPDISWLSILTFLSYPDTMSMFQLNKSFHRYSSNPMVWTNAQLVLKYSSKESRFRVGQRYVDVEKLTRFQSVQIEWCDDFIAPGIEESANTTQALSLSALLESFQKIKTLSLFCLDPTPTIQLCPSARFLKTLQVLNISLFFNTEDAAKSIASLQTSLDLLPQLEFPALTTLCITSENNLLAYWPMLNRWYMEFFDRWSKNMHRFPAFHTLNVLDADNLNPGFLSLCSPTTIALRNSIQHLTWTKLFQPSIYNLMANPNYDLRSMFPNLQSLYLTSRSGWIVFDSRSKTSFFSSITDTSFRCAISIGSNYFTQHPYQPVTHLTPSMYTELKLTAQMQCARRQISTNFNRAFESHHSLCDSLEHLTKNNVQFTSVRTLRIYDFAFVSKIATRSFLDDQCLPNLRHLTLYQCSFTVESLEAFLETCASFPHLQSIHFYKCFSVWSNLFYALANGIGGWLLKNLQCLLITLWESSEQRTITYGTNMGMKTIKYGPLVNSNLYRVCRQRNIYLNIYQSYGLSSAH